MVSIIILSYNTSGLISACLRSIFTYVKGIEFEVIVVDNNSHDQTVHIIKTTFPNVRVIESKTNLGFGKGVNLGASHAKGDVLLFLNSDTEFFDESLSSMVNFLRDSKDQKVAVVGGSLINKNNATSSSYNSFYHLGRVFSLLFHEKDVSKILKKPTRVDWVSGGFMLIWKDIFEKFHGFDKGYFMYIEDMDLCFRLSKKGFYTFFYPETKVRHIGQGSSNRSFAIIQIYKGLLYFYKSHKPTWQYLLLKIMLITKATSAVIIGILTGNTYLRKTYVPALREIL